MFKGEKYIPRNIHQKLPSFLQIILWYMVETMQVEKKDNLQVFELHPVEEDGKIKQRIVHTQEHSNFRKEYTTCSKTILKVKIHVIDDGKNCTMLLVTE